MYAVTITWQDGTVTKATVTRESLKHFSMRACRGASVKWQKV